MDAESKKIAKRNELSDRESHEWRRYNFPSNEQIIGAFSNSEQLELFHVANTANSVIHVLAENKDNAKIIALMGGHIWSLNNARFSSDYKMMENCRAVQMAISDGVPGAFWIGKTGIIMHHKIYRSEAL